MTRENQDLIRFLKQKKLILSTYLNTECLLYLILIYTSDCIHNIVMQIFPSIDQFSELHQGDGIHLRTAAEQ